MVSLALVLVVAVVVGIVVIAAIITGIVLLVRAGSKPSASPSYPPGPALNAPAGWYPDHARPHLLRYFAGRAWTSSTQPRD
jgi:Protein of unknown function (DUF2510)